MTSPWRRNIPCNNCGQTYNPMFKERCEKCGKSICRKCINMEASSQPTELILKGEKRTFVCIGCVPVAQEVK